MKKKKVYHYLVIYKVNNYRNGTVEKYRECSSTIKTGRPFLSNSLTRWIDLLSKDVTLHGYDNFDITIQSLTRLN